MDLEKEVRSLRRVVRVQSVVVVVILFWTIGAWALSNLLAPLSRVSVVRDGKSVAIRTFSDGPFIVTHLTVRGQDADGESEKRTAALPQPTACIDSGGIYIEDITKLDWRDITGKPVPPPDASARITALMLRPEYIEPRAPSN